MALWLLFLICTIVVPSWYNDAKSSGADKTLIEFVGFLWGFVSLLARKMNQIPSSASATFGSVTLVKLDFYFPILVTSMFLMRLLLCLLCFHMASPVKCKFSSVMVLRVRFIEVLWFVSTGVPVSPTIYRYMWQTLA